MGNARKPLRKLIPRAGPREEISLRLARIADLTDFQLYLLVDLVLRETFGVLQDVDRTHFDAAKRLIRSGRSGKAVHFPHGIVARLEHGSLVVSKKRRSPRRRARWSSPGPADIRFPGGISPAAVESVDARGVDPKEARRRAASRVSFFPSSSGEKAGRPLRPVRDEGRKEAERPVYRSKVPLSRRGGDPRLRGRPGRILGPGSRGGRADEDRPGNARGALRIKLFPVPAKVMAARRRL